MEELINFWGSDALARAVVKDKQPARQQNNYHKEGVVAVWLAAISANTYYSHLA